MDNDNEIRDAAASEMIDRKKEVRLFLEEELAPIEKSRQPNSMYDLEGEFAKTRKNKSFFIPGLMLACISVVCLVTFFVAHNVMKSNERISVPAGVFNDLDMGSLLKNRSSAEIHRVIALNRHDSLEQERKEALEQAVIRRDSELLVLSSLHLDSGVETARKKIRDNYTADIKAVHKAYDSQIEDSEASLKKLDEQLSLYDKQIQGRSGGFADQVRQRERKLLTDSYSVLLAQASDNYNKLQQQDYSSFRSAVARMENKYQNEIAGLDPVLKDAEGNAILQDAAGYSDIGRDNRSLFVESLPQKYLTDEFSRGINKASDLFDSFSYVNDVVASIPQKHSIPAYVKAEKQLLSGFGIELWKAFSSQVRYMYGKFVDETETNENLRQTIADLTRKNHDLSDRVLQLNTVNEGLHEQNAGIRERYDNLMNDYNAVSEWTDVSSSWFETMAVDDKVDGIILSMKNPGRMNVFLLHDVRLAASSSSENLRVRIAHGWNKSVAEGSIEVSGGLYYFVPDSAEDAQKVQSGDSVHLLHE